MTELNREVQKMICSKCNCETPDNAAFCQNCGASLKTAEKKKRWIAAVIGIAAACVILLIAIIIGAVSSGSGNFIEQKDFIYYVYNSENGKTVFSVGSEILKDTIEGRVSEVQRSADGANMLVRKAGYNSDRLKLYHVSKHGVKEIADDAVEGGISFSGERAYYIDTDMTLYSYDLKSGKKKKVAEDVFPYCSPVLSPDGKSLLYCISSKENGDVTLYYWNNGKSQKLAKNLSPISVSDNGKYIYAMNTDKDIYAMSRKGDDRNKIASNAYVEFVNCDGTEVLLSAEGKVFLSVKGKEKVKVGNVTDMDLIIPETFSKSASQYYPVKSFVNTAVAYRKDYTSETALGFIQKRGREYEIVKVASNVSNVSTVDGKEFYYLKADELCKIKLKRDAASKKLAEEVEAFKLSVSGKYVYMLDNDDTLYRLKGKKKVKVADDVDDSDYFCVLGDGVLYITDYSWSVDEGSLYYSSNGKNRKLISEEAVGVFSDVGAGLAWYASSGGEGFITDNGKKYTQYK